MVPCTVCLAIGSIRRAAVDVAPVTHVASQTPNPKPHLTVGLTRPGAKKASSTDVEAVSLSPKSHPARDSSSLARGEKACVRAVKSERAVDRKETAEGNAGGDRQVGMCEGGEARLARERRAKMR